MIFWNWLWLHLPRPLWLQRFQLIRHSGGEESQRCWRGTSEEEKGQIAKSGQTNPVFICVAQCKSHQQDQGGEKVARTDEKSQNQVVFWPLWVEGWCSRRVWVIQYPGDWQGGLLAPTLAPSPKWSCRQSCRGETQEAQWDQTPEKHFLLVAHFLTKKHPHTNSINFMMKFLDVRLPILKAIV